MNILRSESRFNGLVKLALGLSLACGGSLWAAPGGVSGDLQFWVQSGQGVHLNSSDLILQLDDQSGNGRNLLGTDAANYPLLLDGSDQLFNFHPYMNFTQSGNGDILARTSGGVGIGASDDATIFVVARKASASTSLMTLLELGSAEPPMAVSANNIFIQEPGADGGGAFSGGAVSLNQPQIFAYTWDYSTSDSDIELILNGAISADAGGHNVASVNTSYFSLGAGNNTASNNPWEGEIVEVIVYNSRLQAAGGSAVDGDLHKIHSYLALKYGITLDDSAGSYVNSADADVYDFDDDNDGTADWHDIAGIAKDTTAGLDQRVASSMNSSAILTVSTDNNFVYVNTVHADTLSDNAYLVWGHNGESATTPTTTELTTALPTTYNYRIPREWKVQNTGVTQAVNLYFAGFSSAAGTEYFLLSDDDGDFSNGGTVEEATSPYAVFDNITLDVSRPYLTLAAKAPVPGGVSQQLEFRVKADEGVSVNGSNEVTQWLDVSGNGAHADNAGSGDDPVYTAASAADDTMNFHPYITFGDEVLSKTTGGGISISGDNAEVFVVARRTNSDSANGTLLELGGNAPFMGISGAGQNARIIGGTADNTGSATTQDQRHILSYDWSSSGAAATSVDGTRGAPAGDIGSPDATAFTIGNGSAAGGSEPFRGDLAEIIVYSAQLSAAERLRVNSFLAIKYGITLPESLANYVDSADAPVYAIDSTYKNNIVGIARDVSADLDQRISRSAAVDSVLTLSSDNSFTGSNASHEKLSDGQFLIAGHNGDSVATISSSDLDTDTYRSRMAREWKVVNTGSVGGVSLQFSGAGIGFTGATYYLLGSSDSDFSSEFTLLGSSSVGAAFSNVFFPDGTSYFTVAVTGSGPAGVTDDIAFWLKADQGVTADGANNVTAWLDAAGQGFDISSVAGDPQLLDNTLNFNPSVDFDGNDEVVVPVDVNPSAADPLELYLVYELDATGGSGGRLLGNDDGGYDTFIGSYAIGGDDNTHTAHATAADVTGQAKLMSVGLVDGSTSEVFVDGVSEGTFTYDNAEGGLPNLSIGSFGGATKMDGRIAEVVAFRNGSLKSAAERNRIASYLAIKYGITLGVDANLGAYTNSADTVIFDPDDGANGGSDNDGTADWSGIAGIGRDDDSTLDQRIAKSSTTGAVFIGSIDTDFSSANSSHASTLEDMQYLLWGHDGGLTSLSQTTEVPAIYQGRMAREWKVQNTGVSSVNIKISSISAAPGAIYYLLSDSADSDQDFSNAVSIASSTTGEFAGVTLADGTHYLTVAVTKPTPGGVLGDNVMWLKADAGVSDDGTEVTDWVDQSGSGNGRDGDVGTPQLLTNQINFNPAVDFDGAEEINTPLNVDPSQGDPLNFYIVYEQTATGGLLGNDNGNWDTLISTDDGIGASNAYWTGHITSETADDTNVPKLLNVNFDHGASGGSSAYVDGTSAGTFTYNYVSGSGASGLTIGAIGPSKNPITAKIAEVIAYRGDTQTGTERDKVSSYLALKYGITLNNGATAYLDASGAAVYPVDGDFDNSIAGLAKDELSGIDQRISKSVEAGAVLTVSTDTDFTGKNDAHFDELAEGQYVVWGHNGATADLSSTADLDTATYQRRMLREWKVVNSEAETITLSLDLSNITVVAAGTTYYLLSKTGDHDFSSGYTELRASASGAFRNVTIPAGTTYLTVAVNSSGPGGVGNGLQIWTKANEGTSTTTDGSTVSVWSDQSGNGRDLGDVDSGDIPIYKDGSTAEFNFNPFLDFRDDGDGDILGFDSGGHGVGSGDDATLFVVARRTSSSCCSKETLLEFGNEEPYMGMYYDDIAIEEPSADGGSGVRGGELTTNRTHVMAFTWTDDSGDSDVELVLDGEIYEDTNYFDREIDSIDTGSFYVGAGDSDRADHPWVGQIAEVIVFNKRLASAGSAGVTGDLRKVTSYLALKYGVTLRSDADDYVDSSGTSVYEIDATYDNNILGIAKQDASLLDQRIAKSVESNVLTLSTDSDFDAPNLDHADTLGDGQYMVMGDNDSSASISSTADMHADFGLRMAREWKVQNTGVTTTVNIKIAGLSPDATYHLLGDDDDTFSDDGLSSSLASSSNGEFTGVTIPTGTSYLTVASVSGTPGGIGAGDLMIWTRADAGTSTTTDGASVTTWDDQSGNSRDLGNVDSEPPAYKDGSAAEFNFNPYLEFKVASYQGDVLGYESGHGVGNSSGDEATVLVVMRKTSTDTNYQTLVDFGNADPSLSVQGNKGLYYDSYHTDTIEEGDITNGASSQPHILAATWTISTSDSDIELVLDGTVYDDANNKQTWTGYLNTSKFYVGSHDGNAYEEQYSWEGDIAEVILYDTRLQGANKSVAEGDMLKVYSYLALKYGITLDSGVNNYVDSSATSVYSFDGTFDNDIFGVAKEGSNELDQRIARSMDTAGSTPILTVSTDSDFTSVNASHADTLSDGQYVVFGNDAGATSISQTTELDSGYTSRMAREWKVSNSGASAATLNLDFSTLGSGSTTYYLISKTGDHDFSTGTTLLGTSTDGSFTDVDIPAGTSYFTVAISVPGPGGVSGHSLWLRADVGVTDPGTGLTAWLDQSGNGYNASSFVDDPMLVQNQMNFNPAVDFDETSANRDGVRVPIDVDPGAAGNTQMQFYVVYEQDALGALLGNDDHGWDTFISTDHFGVGGNNTFITSHLGASGTADELNIPKLINVNFDHQNSAVSSIYVDGANEGNFTFWSATGGAPDLTIGGAGLDRTAGNNQLTADARIAEVIIYRGSTQTSAEREQVSSYLALKYGITLDADDYVNSSGDSVFDTTGSYANDIAGIAKDGGSVLDQRISKSAESTAILTVTTDGDFTAQNDSHADNLTDGQYLVWGHDGGTVTLDSTADVDSGEYASRVARAWRFENTGAIGGIVDLKFDGLIASGGAFLHLLESSDGTFATGATSVATSINGEFLDVVIQDDHYYTVAISATSAPGGVAANLGVWMRADLGVTDSGTALSAWADQAGNGHDASSFTSDPHLLENQINFNDAIEFDGNDSATIALDIDPDQNPDPKQQVYVVYRLSNTSESGLLGNENGGGDTFITTAEISADDSVGSGVDTSHATAASVAGVAKLMAVDFDHTASNGSTSYVDGAVQGSFTYDNANGGATTTSIGSTGGTVFMNGLISEVVTYSGAAQSAPDRNKVQSYLALKYGITLDNAVGNYLDGAGGSVFDIDGGVSNSGISTWTGIAGLAFDTDSSLNQQIARSTLADTVMTVAREADFTSKNAGRANPLAEGEYLVWGHNGGGTSRWSTTDLAVTANHKYRFDREWKFENNSGAGIDVHIRIDALSAIAGVTYYLLSDTDGDFTAGATQLASSTTGDFSSVTLPDGVSYMAVASSIAPEVELETSAVTVSDGEGAVTVAAKVLLNASFAQPVSYTYQTNDGSATAAAGDFTAISSTVGTFAPGVNSNTINISVLDDANNGEGTENFTFTLSASAPVTTGSPDTLTISIIDAGLPLIGDLGKSPGTPFTSLGMSNYVNIPGTYYFNIGGQVFDTYVDENGWVLVASGDGDVGGSSPYTTDASLDLQSDKTLPAAVLAALTDADEVRINDGGTGGTLDISSSEVDVLNRLRANTSLVYSGATTGTWTGTGYVAPAGSCSSDTLQKVIYDGCTESTAIHWMPDSGKEGVNDSSNTDLNLWVRAPAPTAEGVQLWLQGYNGLESGLLSEAAIPAVNGEPVHTWTSQAGDGAPELKASSSAKQPTTNTSGVNFNISADFENQQQLAYDTAVLNTAGNDPATILVVASREQVTAGDDDLVSFPGGTTGDAGNGTGDLPSLGFAAVANRLQAQVSSDTYVHSRDLALKTPYILSLRMDNTPGADKLKLGVDGEEQSFTLNNAVDADSLLVIGAGNNSLSEAFYGSVSEVLVYDKMLDDIIMQQLVSYLALRYGITLTETTSPYLDSKTNYVFEADDNGDGTPDWFNIAGIFKDNLVGQEVDQRIALSQNLSARLTISTDDNFADPNYEHVDGLTSGQYLVWGGKRLQTSVTTTQVAAPFSKRIERYWKIRNTGFVTGVGVYVQDMPALGSGEEYSLVVSSDENFSTGLEVLGTSTTGAFSDIDFPAGTRYFTIAIGSAGADASELLHSVGELAFSSLGRVLEWVVPEAQAVDLHGSQEQIAAARSLALVLAFAVHTPGIDEPVYDDYVRSGITGLSASDIAALHLFITAADTSLVHLISDLQGVINRILRFKGGANPAPALDDFSLVGVTEVTADNLAEVKALLTAEVDAGVLAESPAFVQALVDSVNALITVRGAAGSGDGSAVTMALLAEIQNLVAVSSANLTLYQTIIAAMSSAYFDDVAGLNEVLLIANKVLDLAAGQTVSLTRAELTLITIPDLTSSNLSDALTAIENSTVAEVDTLAELKAVIADAIQPEVTPCSTAVLYTAPFFIHCYGLDRLTTIGVTGLDADNFADFAVALELAYPPPVMLGSSGPEILANIQAVVDSLGTTVSPEETILAEVSAAAAAGDASGITFARLSEITALQNLNINNHSAYQAYIASRQADQINELAELQALINFVNQVIAQAANNDNTDPVLTAADFEAFGFAVDADSLDAVLLAIAATEDDGSEVNDFDKLTAVVNAALARHLELTVLTEVSAAAAANDASSITVARLSEVVALQNLDTSHEAAYQAYIASRQAEQINELTELQALINFVNQVIAQAVNNDNTDPVLTAADFAAFGFAVDADSLEAVLLAIAATADDGSEVNDFDKLTAVVNAALARHTESTVLAEVAAAAAAGDASDITVARLGEIAALQNLNWIYESVYQAYIAARQAEQLDELTELQALIDFVNKVVGQSANNSNSNPELTVADFVAFGFAVDADSLEMVLLAIAATADDGSGVDDFDKLTAVVNKALARYAVLAEVLEDSLSGAANANRVMVTLAQLHSLQDLSDLVASLEGEYQKLISASRFAALPTVAELQALIDGVNKTFIALDSDGDGLTDLYETQSGTNWNDAAAPTSDGQLDGDDDGLTVAQEAQVGFDDSNSDSDSSKTAADEAGNGISDALEDIDGDGIPNKTELMFGFDATDADQPVADGQDHADADADGNGVTDSIQGLLQRIGIDEASASSDFDGDGISDVDEVRKGSNPMSATETPPEPDSPQQPDGRTEPEGETETDSGDSDDSENGDSGDDTGDSENGGSGGALGWLWISLCGLMLGWRATRRQRAAA